jgi:hypothetical protein
MEGVLDAGRAGLSVDQRRHELHRRHGVERGLVESMPGRLRHPGGDHLTGNVHVQGQGDVSGQTLAVGLGRVSRATLFLDRWRACQRGWGASTV